MSVDQAAKIADKAARIMVVDDHPALCEGLGHRIESQADMTICGQAADVNEALQKIPELDPDVVIVDIALKNSNGMELIKAIQSRFKRVRTLVHSMYQEALYADRCLRAGAAGYVNKEAHPDEVIKALREILAGRIYLSSALTSEMLVRTARGTPPQTGVIGSLTDRQLEVFRLIAEGLSAQRIADRLHISVHTVETHRENIKRKLNVDTIGELTRHAVLWATER